ncbi:PaaI family thioesterase [Shimia sp. R11_0]|uniref:PaaI family thioesterase n=1 Tax=Shimia sp. R11_0 TaxID=2821096 RepID=UPI001AD9BEC3|nr:PaaI family thioesterase [Shimia sp. R11_0]MBO9479679.1 PaaI family thioesterase [Shimia sp. R11_0]
MTYAPFDPALDETPYGLQKHLGFELTHWDEDYARLELPLAPHLMNRAGIPHGGIYATLLDTVMGFAGCYTGTADHKKLALTLSLTTNFLSRPRGGRLIAEGWRTGGGAKTFFAEGSICDETGERIARGSGAFKVRATTL